MIIKVKEPQPSEVAMINENHIIYTYLHLAAEKDLTEGLMSTGCTAIAYETIQNSDHSLPLLVPMSEVAGKCSLR